ncbi:MAG: PAS domain S-box protein [Deltaproteobacteria bacterium]|nr:PAS domain S-box protein [Deltaproteobacteria bacterium]
MPQRDVTERKRTEDEVEASEIRYRRFFEAAKDGVLILDADTGRITDANPFIRDLLGYSHDELLGKELWEIGPFRDITANRGAFRRLQRKESIRYDNLPLETKGGQQKHVEFLSNVYKVDGKKMIQCNIRDITARHQAEQAFANMSKELEKRVDERTKELSDANLLMKQMVDEGKRVGENIAKSRDRLRNLSGRLHTMLEEERTRISREIHDELGQALTALKLDLASLGRKASSDGKGELSANLQVMEADVNRIIGKVRKISTDLRPGVLDDFGLVDAIEWQAKDFQTRTGIGCKVTIRARVVITDNAFSTAIFRVFQEALTNITRHAAASQVSVVLGRKGGEWILEVRDNGVGISEERASGSDSLGLVGIRERVRRLGGNVTIQGKPGKGTLVRVSLPIGGG